MLKTRLDVVVNLREREEERTLRSVAEASRAATRARQDAEAARERSLTDARQSGTAETWQMLELAHARALSDARTAELKRVESEQGEQAARQRHAVAYRSAEAVRRVAATKRDEMRDELARKDRRDTDEIAAVLFWR